MKNKKLKRFKKKIITDIDLFYLTNIKSKSIVVTGTNGKSTTCKLLAHLLKKNKYQVSLGGNIGTPILNLSNFKKKICNYRGIIISTFTFKIYSSRLCFFYKSY